MTTTKFTKGQEVYITGSWDDRGTFYIFTRVVGSWGKKQAHITHTDGTPCGRFSRVYVDQVAGKVFPATIGLEAMKAEALRQATEWLATRNAQTERSIAGYKAQYNGTEESGYVKALRKDMAERIANGPQVVIK